MDIVPHSRLACPVDRVYRDVASPRPHLPPNMKVQHAPFDCSDMVRLFERAVGFYHLPVQRHPCASPAAYFEFPVRQHRVGVSLTPCPCGGTTLSILLEESRECLSEPECEAMLRQLSVVELRVTVSQILHLVTMRALLDQPALFDTRELTALGQLATRLMCVLRSKMASETPRGFSARGLLPPDSGAESGLVRLQAGLEALASSLSDLERHVEEGARFRDLFVGAPPERLSARGRAAPGSGEAPPSQAPPSAQPPPGQNEIERAVALFRETYQEMRGRGEVTSIEQWLRQQGFFISARQFYTWRKRFENRAAAPRGAPDEGDRK